jgi:acyl dehydratase
MTLTGNDTYFEDYAVGMVLEHFRGKTITEMDNVLITNLVINTAQSHFNEHRQNLGKGMFNRRIVFGGVTIAIVIGLTAQDTSENAIADLGMTGLRLPTPVFHGDTVYAFSEVLEVKDGPDDASGEVRFRHWGKNQDEKLVFEGERRVLIRRRAG